MKIFSSIFIICLIFLSGQSQESSNYFDNVWKNGFRFQSKDGQFKLKFGGLMQTDFAGFKLDDNLIDEYGDLSRGTELRRLRLAHSGLIYGNLKYKFQLEMAGGSVSLKDVYFEVVDIPYIGKVRVGQFNEPMGIEAITSNKNTRFLERNYAEVFRPERNSGIMIHENFLNKDLYIAVGAFLNADKFGSNKDAKGAYSLVTRVVYTPLYKKDENGMQLIHLGLAYRKSAYTDNTYKAVTRNEAHLSHKYVSTGTIEDVQYTRIVQGEVSAVYNSFYIQGAAEFLDVKLWPRADEDRYGFNKFYAYVGYFLTGESLNYKQGAGIYDRVSPKNNFSPKDRTWGAWEVGLRYANIDLDYADINGGKESDITVGLNWYLNPSVRIMNNYTFTDVNDTGKAHTYQARFQLDF